MDVSNIETDIDQSPLERIKENIKRSHVYFKENYSRWNQFRKFVFETSLSEADIAVLSSLSKPQIEFNIIESYISRLLGEFSKQEPSIQVSAYDEDSVSADTIRVVESYLRHMIFDSENHQTNYEVYKDLLSGGFSSIKITTDYANEMSFDQVIKYDRVFDPTLCGYDELARFPHKGDGRFCFELFPMSKSDFQSEYPEINIDKVSFARGMSGFNWSYLNGNNEMLMVADFYEKKKKRVKIVQLVDNKVMKMSDYKKMLKSWDDLMPPPAIKGKPRDTEVEKIVRYRLIEDKIIEYVETDFSMFPLVFVDGNSLILKGSENSDVKQFCRPYAYQAQGAQRLKNFAGITLANGIENVIQSRFKVAKEALPTEADWMDAYTNPQLGSVMVYNAFYQNNPNNPLPPPMEIQSLPLPQEVIAGFTSADSLVQNILGSYDAALGINNNQLSGIAIIEAATQSNAAAMPYIVGYLSGMQRVAQVIVDIIPKYYDTPRTIPILDKENKRSYVKINQPMDSQEQNQPMVKMDYDPKVLNVKIEAGVNFAIQKSRTLMMIKELMGMSPLMQQFFAEKGIPFILDNLEGRGIDQLKEEITPFLQQYEQQKQQQQQQPNPEMIKAQTQMAKIQADAKNQQMQILVDQQKIKADMQKLMADVQIESQKADVGKLKAETEQFSKAIDLTMKKISQEHEHKMDIHDRLFDLHKDQRNNQVNEDMSNEQG